MSLTLAQVVAEIDAELKRGNTIDADIQKGVQYAVRYLQKKRLHMTERRHANIKTVAGQTWYASFSGEDPSDTDQQDDLSEIQFSFDEPAYGGTVDALISVDDCIYIDTAGQKYPLEEVRIDRFNSLRRAADTARIPVGFCRYAQNIGFYQTPSTAGDFIFFMGRFQPFYPTADNHTCVYFDQAIDATKALAKYWIAINTLKDTKFGNDMMAMAGDEIATIKADGAARVSAGVVDAGWW